MKNQHTKKFAKSLTENFLTFFSQKYKVVHEHYCHQMYNTHTYIQEFWKERRKLPTFEHTITTVG